MFIAIVAFICKLHQAELLKWFTLCQTNLEMSLHLTDARAWTEAAFIIHCYHLKGMKA